MIKKINLLIISLMFIIAGCDKNPIKDLLFPNTNDANSWDNDWILYGGVDGVFGEDVRTKSWNPIWPLTDYWDNGHSKEWTFNNTSQHHTGKTSILMQWNGDSSKTYDTKISVNYVGFYLKSDIDAGIDITPGGYKYLKFWVKGSLTSGVVLKITSDACDERGLIVTDLNSSWQEYSMDITKHAGIVNMAAFALESQMRSNGGEVYIDDARYTK